MIRQVFWGDFTVMQDSSFKHFIALLFGIEVANRKTEIISLLGLGYILSYKNTVSCHGHST